jgi:ferredoxin-like protein FixX
LTVDKMTVDKITKGKMTTDKMIKSCNENDSRHNDRIQNDCSKMIVFKCPAAIYKTSHKHLMIIILYWDALSPK